MWLTDITPIDFRRNQTKLSIWILNKQLRSIALILVQWSVPFDHTSALWDSLSFHASIIWMWRGIYNVFQMASTSNVHLLLRLNLHLAAVKRLLGILFLVDDIPWSLETILELLVLLVWVISMAITQLAHSVQSNIWGRWVLTAHLYDLLTHCVIIQWNLILSIRWLHHFWLHEILFI